MNRAVTWVIVATVVIIGGWFLSRNNTPEYTNGEDIDTVLNIPVVGSQATADEIVVESPKLGDEVSSPLTMRGRARGSWYFEASAPVMVIDTTGKILGRGHVEAQGEWMTSEFVPFEGKVAFDKPTTEGGAIIFMNDNPSGEESRAKYLAVPVFFK
jgi:hypothetical protein